MDEHYFKGVTVKAKANIYFDGKVVSHTIIDSEGSRKTLGLIYHGEYHFDTKQPERMEIVSGSCDVTLDGGYDTTTYHEGESFLVRRESGFTITVKEGICEYVCSYEESTGGHSRTPWPWQVRGE
jgi:uncharacterized protein YaiE (UPF0345 family)